MVAAAEKDALAGKVAWLVNDGKAGMMVQAVGVAAELGLHAVEKIVHPTWVTAALAPWGPVPLKDRARQPGSAFGPPFPDFLIATGRQAVPYLRAVRKAATPDMFTIVLQDPKAGTGIADLIWVPEHDTLRGHNVISTLTSPHSFTEARLRALAQEKPAFVSDLEGPFGTVVIGGPNAVYKFSDADCERLVEAVRRFGEQFGSLLLTPSRRTPERLRQMLRQALAGRPHYFWDETGENPYPHMLAFADGLLVTADSVNMCGEACVTGKPVFVFHPEGGSGKFDRFHRALEASGAVRRYGEDMDLGASWVYDPLNSAAEIANEVRKRWFARRHHLPQGWPQP